MKPRTSSLGIEINGPVLSEEDYAEFKHILKVEGKTAKRTVEHLVKRYILEAKGGGDVTE